MLRVHGTSIALGRDGVLLRGPSGSGKSDLALRLIDAGATLIADDQTELRRRNGRLEMRAPATLEGLLEVRGLGIVRVPCVQDVPLRLVIDLVRPGTVGRLPEPRFVEFDGLSFPLLELAPFEVSAAAKLRVALVTLSAAAFPEAFGVS